MRDDDPEGRFMTEMMTTPATNGEAPLPKRASRGLLPSTWLSRQVRIEYVDAGGKAGRTSGVLLDLCPLGPVVSVYDAKTVLSWDRICLVELQED